MLCNSFSHETLEDWKDCKDYLTQTKPAKLSFPYLINASRNTFLDALVAASNSDTWPLITSTYGFPFPSFWCFAALNVSITSFIRAWKIKPSVYRSIVLQSSLFSLQHNTFARLFAPFADHLIRRCFILMVMTVQFWDSCTPIFLYTIPSLGSGIFRPCFWYGNSPSLLLLR